MANEIVEVEDLLIRCHEVGQDAVRQLTAPRAKIFFDTQGSAQRIECEKGAVLDLRAIEITNFFYANYKKIPLR